MSTFFTSMLGWLLFPIDCVLAGSQTFSALIHGRPSPPSHTHSPPLSIPRTGRVPLKSRPCIMRSADQSRPRQRPHQSRPHQRAHRSSGHVGAIHAASASHVPQVTHSPQNHVHTASHAHGVLRPHLRSRLRRRSCPTAGHIPACAGTICAPRERPPSAPQCPCTGRVDTVAPADHVPGHVPSHVPITSLVTVPPSSS